MKETSKVTPDEYGKLVWEGLQDWLNGQDTVDPDVREILLDRMKDLRLRMQAIFIEIQRRALATVALNITMEDSLRQEMRNNWPFMSPANKALTYKTLQDIDVHKLKMLETQLAGFDFFNTVEISLQTMDTTKVTVELADKVRKLPSKRRQAMLSVLQTVINEVRANSPDDDSIETSASEEIPEADDENAEDSTSDE